MIGPRAQRAFVTCALVLVIAGVITSAVRAIHTDRSAVAATGPVPTVRQFLADSVIGNGGYQQGCHYLTPAEQKRVALRGSTAHSCGESLDDAQLRLGGKTYTTTREIYTDLEARTVAVGNAVVVTLRHGGQAHSFVLVPATAAQRDDFAAPASPWRIESGVASLVPRLKG